MSDSNMAAKIISTVIGDIGEKRRWWQYRARVKALPEPYRAAIEAFQRYLMYFGAGGGVSMFDDLADLFEQSAADGLGIRQVVGAEPVEFIEAFGRNYQDESWIRRERDRLRGAIAQAAGEDTGQQNEDVR